MSKNGDNISGEGGNSANKKAEPDNPESLLKDMTDLLKSYESHSKKLKLFVGKEKLTRGDLLKLNSFIQGYESMNDIATQLADAHIKWLLVCGKTSEELNLEEHQFSPVKFDPVILLMKN